MKTNANLNKKKQTSPLWDTWATVPQNLINLSFVLNIMMQGRIWAEDSSD